MAANLGLGGWGADPNEADRNSIIAQANDRAKASGGSITGEMVKYAKSIGMPLDVAEQRMGYAPGTLSGGGVGGGGGGGGAPARPGGAPAGNLGFGQQSSQAPEPPQTNAFQPGSAGGRYAQNPYLQGVAQNLTQQSNDNWTRNIAPSLRSGAMAVGGFGGSRQGVVEANALKDQNANLTNTLGNMYLQDYTQGQNRALQSRQGDQSYDLGLRNNDLGFYNASNSYDLGRRSNDLGYSQLDSNNAQFGANLGLNTLNAQANWANQGVTAANNMQQTPINYFNNFNNNTNTAAGQGVSGQNTTGSSSDPYLQGAGLMQAGQQMYNQYNTQNDPYNIGQGSAYGGQRRGL